MEVGSEVDIMDVGTSEDGGFWVHPGAVGVVKKINKDGTIMVANIDADDNESPDLFNIPTTLQYHDRKLVNMFLAVEVTVV